jgi:hypothetical protein
MIVLLVAAMCFTACEWFDWEEDNPNKVTIKKVEKVTANVPGLTNGELNLAVGDDITLEIVVSPKDATNPMVKVTSSDDNVIAVLPVNVILAVGTGTATITLVSEDNPNVKETFTVTVSDNVKDVGTKLVDQDQAESRRR